MAKVMYLRHAEEMSSAMMRERMRSTGSEKTLATRAAVANEGYGKEGEGHDVSASDREWEAGHSVWMPRLKHDQI